MNNRFVASADGFPDVSGDSWVVMENHAKVLSSKAKVRVSVPYVKVITSLREPPKFARRTATGINAGTGNVTYRDERGNASQETHSYREGTAMKPFSPEDEAEYLELLARHRELEARVHAIEASHVFDGGLKGEVGRAIDAEHARRAGQETGDAR